MGSKAKNTHLLGLHPLPPPSVFPNHQNTIEGRTRSLKGVKHLGN